MDTKITEMTKITEGIYIRERHARAGTKVRKHALSHPTGARRVVDGGPLPHGSSASPPHAWAENCPPRSAGFLFLLSL